MANSRICHTVYIVELSIFFMLDTRKENIGSCERGEKQAPCATPGGKKTLKGKQIEILQTIHGL